MSANGTVDSEYDIENMIYHWDIDISVDSDNDGDPSNDIDMQGRWVQVIYETEGKKNVKLTVYDESESNSVYMVVNVAKSPFDFTTSVKQNSASILLIILIATTGTIIILRNKENKESDAREKSTVSIDQLFDESNNELEKEKIMSENKIEKGSIEIITETSSVINLEEPEKDKMTINEILSEEDIEALFEE